MATAKLDLLELWMVFETGKHFRCMLYLFTDPRSLGPDKSQVLPMFYAYTGCDTVLSFHTKSKKFAWGTWKAFYEVTATHLVLSTGPGPVEVNNHVALLEQFTILLYDRTSNLP